MGSASEVVREYLASCESGDVSVVDRLFADDFLSRGSGGVTFGLSEQRSNLTSFFEEFADLQLEVHLMLEIDDRVVTHYTHHATLRCSGERDAWDRIVIHRVVGGTIVETAGVSDSKKLADARARASG